MYYHILINTNETGDIYEFDNQNLDKIKKVVIKPYLNNEEFQLNGYFIEPSKVKRLVVTKTQMPAGNCVDDAYDGLSSGIIMSISKQDCVFEYDRYLTEITREILEDVKKELKANGARKEAQTTTDIEEKNEAQETKTIFLGYSYRKVDEEFVSGFKELLQDKGYEVIDGKADGLGSISEAIIEKISLSDTVVIIMTKRDKKDNGKFTTAAWLLEEKGAALALDKTVGMFVEEEVDSADIGGMQGDNQRFHFTRNNFLKVAMNFLKILEKD